VDQRREKEKDEEHKEKNPRNFSGGPGEAGKSENGGNDRHDEEN
jgi:hypothetical protein